MKNKNWTFTGVPYFTWTPWVCLKHFGHSCRLQQYLFLLNLLLLTYYFLLTLIFHCIFNILYVSTTTELPQFVTQAFSSLKYLLYILVIDFFFFFYPLWFIQREETFTCLIKHLMSWYLWKSSISFPTRTKITNVSKIKA